MKTLCNGINVEAKSMVNYLGTSCYQDMARSSMGNQMCNQMCNQKDQCQVNGNYVQHYYSHLSIMHAMHGTGERIGYLSLVSCRRDKVRRVSRPETKQCTESDVIYGNLKRVVDYVTLRAVV